MPGSGLPTRPGSRPGLVCVDDIEICRVGTWSTSTGVFDFTLDDFAAAIAAEADPEVFAASVKVGHTDPRFAAGLDGEPSLGWVRNLHVVGDRLLASLVDMPARLAEVIPHAYPRRSVEMGFQVHTPSGGRYRAAVLGLALLGVTRPAVSGLADVVGLYDGSTTFQVAAAAAAQCAGGVGYFVQDPAWSDARGSVAALAARAGLDGSLVLAAVDQLASMPTASSPNPTMAADTLRPHVVSTPSGGPPMAPLTDARVRELLALEANADSEAALVALRDRAGASAAPPPAPPSPASVQVPGTGPFVPGGFAPPAAAPAPGAPLFVPPGYAPPAAVAPPASTPLPPPPAGYQYDPSGQLVAAPPAATVPPAPAAPPVPAPVAAAPGGAFTPPAAPPAPAVAPVAAPPAPTQAGVADLAAAVAAHLAPQIAAAAAPGMQVAEVMRIRDREAMLAAHARRGALRPTDLDYFRTAYDQNPGGVIAHLAAAPVQFPTFELGVAATPAASTEATAEADRQFLAACGIAD